MATVEIVMPSAAMRSYVNRPAASLTQSETLVARPEPSSTRA